MLGVVGADVLDRGRGESSDQRHELDLFRGEGLRFAANEGDESHGGRSDEQRRSQARAQAQAKQLRLLGMPLVGHVAPVDRSPARERLEDRTDDGL